VHFALTHNILWSFPNPKRRRIHVFHTSVVTACFSPFFSSAASAKSFGFPAKRLRKIEREIRIQFVMENVCKSSGKSVEILRISGGSHCAKPSDFLRQNSGEAAEMSDFAPLM